MVKIQESVIFENLADQKNRVRYTFLIHQEINTFINFDIKQEFTQTGMGWKQVFESLS